MHNLHTFKTQCHEKKPGCIISECPSYFEWNKLLPFQVKWCIFASRINLPGLHKSRLLSNTYFISALFKIFPIK